jgi:hypothetical protein
VDNIRRISWECVQWKQLFLFRMQLLTENFSFPFTLVLHSFVECSGKTHGSVISAFQSIFDLFLGIEYLFFMIKKISAVLELLMQLGSTVIVPVYRKISP